MSPPSPSPVSLFAQLFLPFFIFLHPSIAKLITEEQLCHSSTVVCKETNFNISHPFWRLDGSEEEGEGPICGYPNFNPNYPLIAINGHDYLVKNISYPERSITLLDSQLISPDDTCPWRRLRQSLVLNETAPFTYNPGIDFTLTFFSDCAPPPPDDIPNLYSVGCDSYLFVGPIDPLNLNRIRNCSGKTETAAMRTKETESDQWAWNVSFGAAMKEGFVLDWRKAAKECGYCKKYNAFCGHEKDSGGKVLCFCSNGSIMHDICPSYQTHGLGIAKLFTGLMSGVVGALLVFAVIICGKMKLLRQKILFLNSRGINQNIEAFIKDHGPLALRRFRFAEIKKMTNSFEVKLGQGGYGEVYKGKLQEGQLVAMKLLTISKGNGEDFINEVASISKTSHVNIVNLLGFCLEGHKRVLVYEFMSNGSLDKFIHNNAPGSLSWENLYQIALGTARGLEYLHKGCNTRILHFDIKPHNILLDESFRPKISDFGLAKLCLNKESIISISQARGTVGYLAPEIWNKNFGGISHKSDVYSYGMMLIDMVGGRYNTNIETKSASENYFPDWIYNKLEQDYCLGNIGTDNMDENGVAKRLTIVGLWCIQTFPTHRPTIGQVLEMLEGGLSSLEIPPKPILSSPPD